MAGVKGRSGRRPKPTVQLRLEGGYRADRHGARIPDPPIAIPDPPATLYGIALDEWDRITVLLAEIKLIAKLDMALVAAYCIEWATYTSANNRLRKCRTLLSDSTRKTKRPHPLLTVRNRALANMHKVCAELGLSPGSRSRLNVEAAALDDDPLDRLIRQQAERRKVRAQQPAGKLDDR